MEIKMKAKRERPQIEAVYQVVVRLLPIAGKICRGDITRQFFGSRFSRRKHPEFSKTWRGMQNNVLRQIENEGKASCQTVQVSKAPTGSGDKTYWYYIGRQLHLSKKEERKARKEIRDYARQKASEHFKFVNRNKKSNIPTQVEEQSANVT